MTISRNKNRTSFLQYNIVMLALGMVGFLTGIYFIFIAGDATPAYWINYAIMIAITAWIALKSWGARDQIVEGVKSSKSTVSKAFILSAFGQAGGIFTFLIAIMLNIVTATPSPLGLSFEVGLFVAMAFLIIVAGQFVLTVIKVSQAHQVKN